jgi:hypothetical protein
MVGRRTVRRRRPRALEVDATVAAAPNWGIVAIQSTQTRFGIAKVKATSPASLCPWSFPSAERFVATADWLINQASC